MIMEYDWDKPRTKPRRCANSVNTNDRAWVKWKGDALIVYGGWVWRNDNPRPYEKINCQQSRYQDPIHIQADSLFRIRHWTWREKLSKSEDAMTTCMAPSMWPATVTWKAGRKHQTGIQASICRVSAMRFAAQSLIQPGGLAKWTIHVPAIMRLIRVHI